MIAAAAARAEATRFLSAFVDMVEAGLQRARPRPRWLAVESEDGGFSVLRVSAGRMVSLGETAGWDEAGRKSFLAGTRGTVELRLASDSMVETTLKVPAEARQFAREVIEHRLEKLTPWRPDKLLYGYDVAAQAGDDNQYDVHFSATSREIANAALARLQQSLGVTASAIGSAAEPLDRPLRIDLLDGSADARRRRARRRIAGAASFALAGTFALFVWSEWAVSSGSSDRDNLDARLADVRQRLTSGSRLDPARQRDMALIQSKTPDAAVFILIDRLAKAVPDGTVLDELDIKPESVRIGGTSSDASTLVGLLEGEASLSDAEFAAPVTRQPDGRDRFDIVLSRKAPPSGPVSP